MSALSERVIAAAGGVVWRPAGRGALEVAVVHRPRYDDWSLPKGKLDRGEHALTAAVREVGEETGLQVVVGRRSSRTCYPVADGLKQVDYWVMQAVGGTFEPNDEVDELEWLAPREAAARCSHDHDREVVADLLRDDVPRMPTVLLVRHAHAGSRRDWDGADELRPLEGRGRREAARLAEVLPAFAPTAVLSAPPTRCQETVAPLAERLGLPLDLVPALGEVEFSADPQPGLDLVERLLAPHAGAGVTVVCSQGGAIPAVLVGLGVQWEGTRVAPPAAKGSVWVLGGRRGALSADYHRDFEADPAAPV